MNKVIAFDGVKHFPKEGELYARISDLIEEYNGELSLVAVIGILQLKIQNLPDGQTE